MACCGTVPLDFRSDSDMLWFRVEQLFDHPIADLWKMLTRSEHLESWLAPGSVELAQGGSVHFEFRDSATVIDSIVTHYEPFRTIAFFWNGPGEATRPVRWDVIADDGLVRLSVTLGVPVDEDAGKVFAGWVAHLQMLAAALAGAPIAFPFDQFKAARDRFPAYAIS